jgi:hypothetical protein
MDPTTRWISILGIAALCFGIVLFVLRVPIRTILVFFAIGVPLLALWLYADEKSKQQKRISIISKQGYICSICKHVQAEVCLEQKCACLIMIKGNNVMGHSINPLQ